MFCGFVISMKYSVALEAEYFVVFSFVFGLILIPSLIASPISLNLISCILSRVLVRFFSMSCRMSIFFVPAIR